MSTGNSKSSSRWRETCKDKHLLLETFYFGQWLWKMTGLGQSFPQEIYNVMRNNWVSRDFNCKHIKNDSLKLEEEEWVSCCMSQMFTTATGNQVLSSNEFSRMISQRRSRKRMCTDTKELVQQISHIQFEKLTPRNKGHYSNSASVINPFGRSGLNGPVSNKTAFDLMFHLSFMANSKRYKLQNKVL